MNNKLLYINALLLTVLICISIEIRHQTDLQRIDALTAENAALQQNIADMQSTIDKLLQNMQQLISAACASRGRWGGWTAGRGMKCRKLKVVKSGGVLNVHKS